jgi:hypothetical protein
VLPMSKVEFMKMLYQASNGIEAHMILDLLEQEGLVGRVDGEYLQGGVGELPAAGLVRVMVREQDYAAAKAIVDRWDTAQPTEIRAPARAEGGSRLGAFAFGLALGVLFTYLYYRTPIISEGADYDRNGVLDERRTYATGGKPITSEADRNQDGKIDYVSTFGPDGFIESAELDDNFDGIFESVTIYRLGHPHLTETDTNGNGYRDFRTNFASGTLSSAEYIYPATGRPQKIDYFDLGKLIYSEIDIDKDGKMDRRINYNELGERVTAENIEQR